MAGRTLAARFCDSCGVGARGYCIRCAHDYCRCCMQRHECGKPRLRPLGEILFWTLVIVGATLVVLGQR